MVDVKVFVICSVVVWYAVSIGMHTGHEKEHKNEWKTGVNQTPCQ